MALWPVKEVQDTDFLNTGCYSSGGQFLQIDHA